MKLLDVRMSKYLWYYFQSRTYGEGLVGGLVYGVGRPVLSLENMREVPVAICSIDEQREIVEQIESRLSVCDKIEESIEQGLQRAEALRQSILKRAFEGKLVPQDERDENASILLERIKAERVQAQPQKKTKAKKNK
jgi:type I restriction enzyme S subunit